MTPAECPSATQADAEITQLVPQAARALSAQVVISRDSPSQLQAHVTVAGDGEHVLLDASCEALSHAAALVVAMAIDLAAARDVQRTAASSELGVFVGAAGGLASGIVPGVARLACTAGRSRCVH